MIIVFAVLMVHNNSEKEVTEWLKDKYIVEVANSSDANPSSTPGFGVVFHNADDASNLRYTLRPTSGGLLTSEDTLYGEQLSK